MPTDKHLYEYAVIRYVPKVEREEFLNVGLIMMCKRHRWLRVEILLPEARLAAFDSPVSSGELARQLTIFTSVGRGERSAGPIAALEPEERFRWLTAVKSSSLQTSRPHPGLTTDLDAEFLRLFDELVR
ncbi:MAG: DUF3037 domain-containing protein [Muribaculaceae bacterium]|nr:DUF3037 domain-containing protein [Muribaculaceae bacterium]